MKRIILVLFIALFCEAAFAQDNSAPRKSSFYLNGTVGANLTGLNNDGFEGTGLGFAGEVTLGLLIKEAATLQGTLEFYTIDGEFDLPEREKKSSDDIREINSFVFVGGFGTTVFPFARSQNSFMRGTFFGAKALFGIALLSNPHVSLATTYDPDHYSDRIAMGFSTEIGKDWQIAERFHIGVGIRWQFLGIVTSDDSSNDPSSKVSENSGNYINSLQVLFRINRR